MKKIIIMLFAAAFGTVCFSVKSFAQSGPGAGVVPNGSTSEALVWDVVEYCEDYKPGQFLNCDSPEFIKRVAQAEKGNADAHLQCCKTKAKGKGSEGGRGGNGAKGGRNGSVSKPKPYCEKLIKTTFTDNFGYPKYQDPKNRGIMMPPCESPFWNGEGPCCITSDKGGKSNGKGGVKNHAKHHGVKGVMAKSQGASVDSKVTAKADR